MLRHELDGLTSSDAIEMFSNAALRYSHNPRLNLLVASRNVQAVTATVRFILSEKPAASFMGRDLSAEVNEWQTELNEWREARRVARTLLLAMCGFAHKRAKAA